MNYYLGVYEFPILFIGSIVCLFMLLAIFWDVAFWLDNRLELKEKWSRVLLVTSLLTGIGLFVLLLNTVPDYLRDGEVNELYILNKDNQTRLVVRFTRVDTPGGMDHYSHQLKSYDFATGEEYGQQGLAVRYYIDDYRIYGAFDNNKAWGYSRQNGIKLLDLFQPKLLCDQEEILERNPQLGKMIRLSPGRNNYVVNPRTKGLRVSTAQGKVYEIGMDLKAIRPKDVKVTPKKSSKSDPPRPIQKWHIEGLPGTYGKAVYAAGAKLSPNKAVLLYPERVHRWGQKALSLDKAWVMHWSLIGRAGECLLSYVNKNGELIHQINLRRFFNNKRAQPYTVTFYKGEMFVFVSKAEYTLTALRVDPDTGKILGRVDYF